MHAATLAVRAGKPEAAAQLRASALARVAQMSAVGRRLSVEQVYHASKLPPAVLLHEAMRALARGDALAAAAAVDEAQALLGGEVGACRCGCERLPDAAEEVGEVGEVEVPCKWCGAEAADGDSCCAPCRRSHAAHSVAGGPDWARRPVDVAAMGHALRVARHELVTLHGLLAADGAAPAETWSIDTNAAIAAIDAALTPGATP